MSKVKRLAQGAFLQLSNQIEAHWLWGRNGLAPNVSLLFLLAGDGAVGNVCAIKTAIP